MAQLKPAYLIHGDDHGALAERRAGLRALAEREGGGVAFEVLEGDAATPAGVATALATMTLGGALAGDVGRVIVVEGVERWRQADVESHLLSAMDDMPPATTVALFAREDARAKAPAAVHRAVKRAGGQVVEHAHVKPRELPRWVTERAAAVGLALDAAAAKALIAQVGDRPQRLLRELEKLALEGPVAGEVPSLEGEGGGGNAQASPAAPGRARAVGVAEIESRAARSAEWRAFALADALAAGDRAAATRAYLHLRAQGERLPGLIYLIAQRLRDALAVSLRLRAGESPAEIRRGLRMPSFAAQRLLADAARSDPERLGAALARLADLELDSRGGAPLLASRTSLAGLDEDTLAVRTIELITR